MAWQFGWLRPTRARRIGQFGGSSGLPLVSPQSQPPGTQCRASPNNFGEPWSSLTCWPWDGQLVPRMAGSCFELRRCWRPSSLSGYVPSSSRQRSNPRGDIAGENGHAVSGSPSPSIRQQGQPAAPPQPKWQAAGCIIHRPCLPLPPTPSFKVAGRRMYHP